MTAPTDVPDADRLDNHWWWRPGWCQGRSFYTWHLTFDGQDELHHLVEQYQRVLHAEAGLDLIPRQWLHLTLQGVGFTDKISEQDVHAIVDAAQRRLAQLPPACLTFHQPTIFGEAVVLLPAPADAVAVIRGEVRAAIGDVWGADRVPERADTFQPHVTLAYSNAQQATAGIAAELGQVDAGPARATITEVSLIDLNRDHRMYQWRTIAIAPLASR